MIDYTIFYKTMLPLDKDWSIDNSWDLFISAYNSSDRVQQVFEQAKAEQKHWIVFPDYSYSDGEWPSGTVYAPIGNDESEVVSKYFEESGIDFSGKKVCVDITGFIKPYMMFLLKWFFDKGVRKFEVIYSEPEHYIQQEETKFSDGPVFDIRQVAGFEGTHIPDTSNDITIIGSGYDHELIGQVAENKDDTRKIQLFGLPSLRPDMFQENILRAHRAANAVGAEIEAYSRGHFAPANDPFVTAEVLSEIVRKENSRQRVTNLYLSPLATKPQALGFAIYYLTECCGKAVSMIYPFCRLHSRETSKGTSRIWKYVVELPS